MSVLDVIIFSFIFKKGGTVNNITIVQVLQFLSGAFTLALVGGFFSYIKNRNNNTSKLEESILSQWLSLQKVVSDKDLHISQLLEEVAKLRAEVHLLRAELAQAMNRA